eukprot:GHVN01107184.1.p1 GENE.GHVN01107184.1~~GHVN01107184.1.p1  ORF type:complete len:922 (+),score=290.16 GHVN01107184.1:50-2767(+)
MTATQALAASQSVPVPRPLISGGNEKSYRRIVPVRYPCCYDVTVDMFAEMSGDLLFDSAVSMGRLVRGQRMFFITDKFGEQVSTFCLNAGDYFYNDNKVVTAPFVSPILKIYRPDSSHSRHSPHSPHSPNSPPHTKQGKRRSNERQQLSKRETATGTEMAEVRVSGAIEHHPSPSPSTSLTITSCGDSLPDSASFTAVDTVHLNPPTHHLTHLPSHSAPRPTDSVISEVEEGEDVDDTHSLSSLTSVASSLASHPEQQKHAQIGSRPSPRSTRSPSPPPNTLTIPSHPTAKQRAPPPLTQSLHKTPNPARPLPTLSVSRRLNLTKDNALNTWMRCVGHRVNDQDAASAVLVRARLLVRDVADRRLVRETSTIVTIKATQCGEVIWVNPSSQYPSPGECFMVMRCDDDNLLVPVCVPSFDLRFPLECGFYVRRTFNKRWREVEWSAVCDEEARRVVEARGGKHGAAALQAQKTSSGSVPQNLKEVIAGHRKRDGHELSRYVRQGDFVMRLKRTPSANVFDRPQAGWGSTDNETLTHLSLTTSCTPQAVASDSSEVGGGVSRGGGGVTTFTPTHQGEWKDVSEVIREASRSTSIASAGYAPQPDRLQPSSVLGRRGVGAKYTSDLSGPRPSRSVVNAVRDRRRESTTQFIGSNGAWIAAMHGPTTINLHHALTWGETSSTVAVVKGFVEVKQIRPSTSLALTSNSLTPTSLTSNQALPEDGQDPSQDKAGLLTLPVERGWVRETVRLHIYCLTGHQLTHLDGTAVSNTLVLKVEIGGEVIYTRPLTHADPSNPNFYQHLAIQIRLPSDSLLIFSVIELTDTKMGRGKSKRVSDYNNTNRELGQIMIKDRSATIELGTGGPVVEEGIVYENVIGQVGVDIEDRWLSLKRLQLTSESNLSEMPTPPNSM